MKIEPEKIDDILVLTPCDPVIDASSAADFKAQLVTWIQEDNTRILLDLSFIEFIDSSGLGAIISLLKLVAGKGDISLCGIREQVMSLFKLTRMDRIFRFYTSSTEALEAMKAGDKWQGAGDRRQIGREQGEGDRRQDAGDRRRVAGN
jgi:anti-sigma B factor antagonist